jgi:hypothetical protein
LIDPDLDPEVIFQSGGKEDENDDDDGDIQVSMSLNLFLLRH